jgi:predicted dinucleotide-binding enzyme
MKIGVFGTGIVGQTLASKLVELGHSVRMGSRTTTNAGAAEWAKKAGQGASHGTFADAAKHGEMLFNCTNGQAALAALGAADPADLAGKVLVDVSNPLDFSRGMPPSLFVSSTESLGERIQSAFPGAKVVKTLNTVSAPLMVEPGRLAKGEHSVFVCGNDAAAKKSVEHLLRTGFGWKDVVDLGDITMARGAEAYLMLWTRLYGALQSPEFNIRVVR